MNSKSTSIKYGIIGTGMMGCEHIMNIALLENAEVVAFADPNDRSRQWGENFSRGEAAAFADFRRMLDSIELDAVVVATPNHTHKQILDELLGRPINVLCEKPLCSDAQDALEVAYRAASHPGIFWVAMEYRYMRPVEALLRELRAGEVGEVKMVAIREHRFPFLPKVGDWNRFSENTGGTLVEKCCHFFDLMNLFIGEDPVRVYASGAQDVNHLDEEYAGRRPDIIDNAFVVVDYSTGARAMLDLCMFAENSPDEVEIVVTGNAGRLAAYAPSSRLISTRRDRPGYVLREFELDPRLRNAGAHHGSTYYEHVAFTRAINGALEPEVSVWDGALAVLMGAAAEQSIRDCAPVTLQIPENVRHGRVGT